MDNPSFTTFVEYAPGRRATNNDPLLCTFAGIEDRTRIQLRNIASPGETVESIAVHVGMRYYQVLKSPARSHGGLVLASCGSQVQQQAEHVAHSLGVQGWVRGVHFACSGFPAAVQMAADRAKKSGDAILVITAEILSRLVDWSDRDTAILFGDRAAATAVVPDGPHEILLAHAEDFDDPDELIELREMNAVDEHGQSCHRPCFRMFGKPVFRIASERMVTLVEDDLDRLRLSYDELSCLVPHQANGRILERMEEVMEKRGWPHLVPVVKEITAMGNVGSSSIPAALSRVQHDLPNDTLVACPTVGAGSGMARGKLSSGNIIFRVGQTWEE